MTIYEKIENHRLVPVVALNDVSAAVKLADALIAGGLPVADSVLPPPKKRYASSIKSVPKCL